MQYGALPFGHNPSALNAVVIGYLQAQRPNFSRLKTGRRAVLSTIHPFHGKTFAALSATGSERYSTPHIVDVEQFTNVPFNDPDTLGGLQA
ncbi:hypothetical protein [Pseudomonas entomophila]|uniref:hypothetical protein n=1 Tax=Pseudomonas entomophila TaxID=312306 RepID=UPI003EB93AF1